MPVTVSYDLSQREPNQRNYVRSALERFHWKRLVGSVFRYEGVQVADVGLVEDWLNHVVPALMFFRSYAIKNKIKITVFTVDAQSVAMVDLRDAEAPLGCAPQPGEKLTLKEPTNKQSGEAAIRQFVDACTAAAP